MRPKAFAYRPPAREWFRGGVATQRTANPRTGVRFPPEPPASAGPKYRFTDLRREVIAPPVRFDFSPKSQNRPKVFGRSTFLNFDGPSRFRSILFLDSSAVEHSTVNRMVPGSIPGRGASFKKADGNISLFLFSQLSFEACAAVPCVVLLPI